MDFIATFNEMHTQTFKVFTIKLAFAETGLILYNPEKVLNPLFEKLEKKNPILTPLPPLSLYLIASI